MAHNVDGFQLRFTGRNTWKAERRERGELLDVIPVTWTKGWRSAPDGKRPLQEVWYQDRNRNEMESRMADRIPFIVALAEAKNYEVKPHKFKKFKGVFEVIATGTRLSDRSIQTRVLRRIKT